MRKLGSSNLKVSAIGLGYMGMSFSYGLPKNTQGMIALLRAAVDNSDFRSTLPRFTPLALKANQALINRLGSIALQKQATPAQIAIAWLLAQKQWIMPIPGTTKLNRLDENIGAILAELTPDDLREIDDAAAKITVQGARYPEKLEQMTGR